MEMDSEIKISPLAPLYDLSWYKVKLRLQNTRDEDAISHPLVIFNGLFYTVAGKCGSVKKEDFFFHPCQQPLSKRVNKNSEYDLELVFPNISLAAVEDFVASLTSHLRDKKNNFTITGTPEISRRSLAHLETEWSGQDVSKEICLNFLTPLFFKTKYVRREMIDKEDFILLFSRRIHHYFRISLSGLGALWDDIRVLPYYWQSKKYGWPNSQSGAGKQPLQGVTGPFYLRGDISKIMPLLLICSELHIGMRRKSMGRGYYVLRRNQPC